MAFAGLKKQINKANQYVTEKMGAAEGTKMDDDFVEMERKTDITYELVEDLQMKTKEFLQPNPTARAKMAAVKGISKLSGQAKAATYPQPEGTLGEAMLAYGRKLGEESVFAAALVETGESMKQLADVKYSLDDNVKQNFLEPLHHLQSKDLKEVMHHRKKLHGRRLDFDCKKRKQTKGGSSLQSSPYGSPARSPSPYRGAGSSVTEDEIRQAEEKFAESLHLAQMGMNNILDNDVEQIAQLACFAEGLLEYHKQCTDILKVLTETLHDKRNEAASKPRKEFIPKTLADLPMSMGGEPTMHQPGRTTPSGLGDGFNGMNNSNKTPAVSPGAAPGWDPFGNNAQSNAQARSGSRPQPCATAVYDFDPENPGELGFKEGDNITLLSRIDENWFEGSLNGQTGFFPVNYVTVTVPLP